MALHFVGFKFCTLALQGIGYGGDCPRTQIPIGGNLQIESERPDDMGKTSESLAELGGNQSGYAQEISNRKFETPSNGVIGRPGGGKSL